MTQEFEQTLVVRLIQARAKFEGTDAMEYLLNPHILSPGTRGVPAHLRKIHALMFDEIAKWSSDAYALALRFFNHEPGLMQALGSCDRSLRRISDECVARAEEVVWKCSSAFVDPLTPRSELHSLTHVFRQQLDVVFKFALQAARQGKSMSSIGEESAMSVQTVTVNLGSGATFSGDVITAKSIERSFNGAVETPDQKLRVALEDLVVQVGRLMPHLGEELRSETARCLEEFVAESKKPKPSPRWYNVSAGGLLEAAEAVSSLTEPISKAVKSVLELVVGET